MEKPDGKIILEQLINSGNGILDALNEYCAHASKVTTDLLMRVLYDNKDTEYGRKYDFANIRSIEEYKAKVPLSSYDDYALAISEMVTGKKNLITAYPINHYALTSGSVDNPKNIPVSKETLEIYEKYGSHVMIAVVNNYIEQAEKRKVKEGRRLLALDIKEDFVKDGTSRGPISSTVYLKMKELLPLINVTPNSVLFPKESMNQRYLRAFYALRETDLSGIVAPFMTALADLMYYIENNWEMLVHDIETGTIDESVNIPKDLRRELTETLVPDPKRAKMLRMEFREGFGKPIIPRIWPDMDYIAAIGTGGFSVYTDKMRYYSGNLPMYFLVYGASESLMGVAVKMESSDYVLLPQSGFYEFIPADCDDETKTYNIDELEENKEYEIVLTNLSGFYRYRLGDVVRVTGYMHESPMLCFVYRKKQMVSIAGEKTNEACLSWAVEEFGKETDIPISDYSIYADTDTLPGRYVLFMEPGRCPFKENYEHYRAIIEQKLSIANPSFGAKVKDGILKRTEIKFVQPETYYLYRDMMQLRGVSENQLKPVRVIDNPSKKKFFFALIDNE